MAKPFYSMDEVCERLGKSPDEVRELVGDGMLREFRDAGKVFFKAEDVEKLAGGGAETADSGDTSEIMLEAVESDSDAEQEATPPPSPASSSGEDVGGGTSIIGLMADEDESEGEEDETPERSSKPPKPPKQKEDTVITASGIGVFDDDELEIDADPMAKTQITSAEIDDDVQLESGGSGSGLLDLTRESDDTSLGAELLDEIYPGEGEEEEAAEEAEAVEEAEPEEPAAVEEEEAVAETEEEPVAASAGPPVAPAPTVAVGDPYEGLFGGFLVASLIMLALAGSVVGGVLQGYLPDYARLLTDNFLLFLAGAGVALVLSVVIGLFLGRALTPRRR
jgi:hypothetical protein